MIEAVSSPYRRLASLKDADDFSSYIRSLGLTLGFDGEIVSGAEGPLGTPYQLGDIGIGNRFCVLPMEGWDGETDGRPLLRLGRLLRPYLRDVDRRPEKAAGHDGEDRARRADVSERQA